MDAVPCRRPESCLAQKEHPKNLLGAVVGDAGGKVLSTVVQGSPLATILATASCWDPGQLARSQTRAAPLRLTGDRGSRQGAGAVRAAA
jgi:hypothetical protein